MRDLEVTINHDRIFAEINVTLEVSDPLYEKIEGFLQVGELPNRLTLAPMVRIYLDVYRETILQILKTDEWALSFEAQVVGDDRFDDVLGLIRQRQALGNQFLIRITELEKKPVQAAK